ncbi:helix-turn-helix transcriptional regulator [Gracilibacillus oryzae]|uniref:Helix-turn-helix transcriptional regulator n=1 Tax=Gracilibacillus oryzae TaxID=1672701 RepID=A0A7C8KRN0_9BACI|nr:helix-turn-helix transcriptional regulator [Gracilibacillus oryzae]KAB8133663.1 helix-turn-helix transcriptional regulator [Gracilibacillus oryzae]
MSSYDNKCMKHKVNKRLTVDQAIGLHIRHRREDLGYTREKVADKTGLSINGIDKIEKGKVNPLNSSIIKICNALDMEANEIQQIFTAYTNIDTEPNKK